MAVWVFSQIIPSEVEPGAAMLRQMGAGTVMTHKTLAGTLLQINSGRDDVEQLVSRVLPSAVLVGRRDKLGGLVRTPTRIVGAHRPAAPLPADPQPVLELVAVDRAGQQQPSRDQLMAEAHRWLGEPGSREHPAGFGEDVGLDPELAGQRFDPRVLCCEQGLAIESGRTGLAIGGHAPEYRTSVRTTQERRPDSNPYATIRSPAIAA